MQVKPILYQTAIEYRGNRVYIDVQFEREGQKRIVLDVGVERDIQSVRYIMKKCKK